MPKPTGFQLPADLAGLRDEELASSLTTAQAEFDALYEDETAAVDLERATYLADSIDSIRSVSRDAT